MGNSYQEAIARIKALETQLANARSVIQQQGEQIRTLKMQKADLKRKLTEANRGLHSELKRLEEGCGNQHLSS